MAKAAVCPIPPDRLAVYEKLVASFDVKLKGAKSAYTSMNGNMFSFMTPEGRLAVRLPDDEREAFMKKHKNALCIQYDTVMKHYVLVPDAWLKKPAQLKKVFGRSVEHATTLAAKPTTRKKSAKKKPAAKKKPVAKKAARKKR